MPTATFTPSVANTFAIASELSGDNTTAITPIIIEITDIPIVITVNALYLYSYL